jgi:hypothetical protein
VRDDAGSRAGGRLTEGPVRRVAVMIADPWVVRGASGVGRDRYRDDAFKAVEFVVQAMVRGTD